MSKAMGGGKLEGNLDLATNRLIVEFSHPPTLLQSAITAKSPRFLLKDKDKDKDNNNRTIEATIESFDTQTHTDTDTHIHTYKDTQADIC